MPAGGPLQDNQGSGETRTRNALAHATGVRDRFLIQPDRFHHTMRREPLWHPGYSRARFQLRSTSACIHPEQGAGFEPAKAFATGFADRPLRPLGNPCFTHHQHAREESNPRPPGLESGALPAELQAYVCRGPSVRPEGFEPRASGFVIRRSAPVELRAHASHQAPGGIRTLNLRTGGPALCQLSYRCISIHHDPFKCPEGIEPSASGVEVRRSCPAELQARRRLFRWIFIAQPAGSPHGAEQRTAPGVAFARPGAACPGGFPRGLRCSF